MLLASLFLFDFLSVLTSDESQWIGIDTEDLLLTSDRRDGHALGPLEGANLPLFLSSLLASLLLLVIEEQGHVEVLRAHISPRKGFERWELSCARLRFLPAHQEEALL